MKCLQLICFLCFGLLGVAQNSSISGVVKDNKNQPVPFVNINVLEVSGLGTSSNDTGFFSLPLPSGFDTVTIQITAINIKTKRAKIAVNNPPAFLEIVVANNQFEIPIVDVVAKKDVTRKEVSTEKLNIKKLNQLPNPSGGIEGFLAGAIGVSKNNELSSAYSVRGGNFDENLVYVNGFEVYRPYLIRSGQQEGLSFINPNLVDNVEFSAGGFQAKYGDKMASVLSVDYKRPKQFHGSLEMSLLGGSMHLEGTDKKNKFTWLFGLRNKTATYLLRSQDTEGQYLPSFVDVQAFLTYKVSNRVMLEYITNYSRNKFDFTPENRTTDFGLVNQTNRFTIDYEGQENDLYQAVMNGLAINIKATDKVNLKFLGSQYYMDENERFDLIGEYLLGEVETDPSQENAGEIKLQLGTGTFHDWARNRLTTKIYSGAHKGEWKQAGQNLKWGFTYKKEILEDVINEWERQDSAGYSLPTNNPNQVELFSVLKSEFNLNSNRYSGYVQNTSSFGDSTLVTLNYGARFQYWDVNKEFVVSPRAQLSIQPLRLKNDVVFTAAAGMYYQPPFYREMRNLQGQVNTNLKAQKSAHFVAGVDYGFTAWNRKFKFVTEAYYKYHWDLVPYEFDNVLIRYFGTNNSKGFTTGIDLRLNGELAKGAESWISLGYMHAQEDIEDDYFIINNYYKERIENQDGTTTLDTAILTGTESVFPGNIPRPTDQRISFALFFQDYIPKLDFIKAHIGLVVGTGLPFGPPDSERFRDQFRIPPYRRLDLGLSASLFDIERLEEKKKVPKSFFKHVDKIWMSFEIFNLLDFNNTVSYIWVRGLDVRTGSIGQYAVPNYLTGRRFNLRFRVEF